MICLYTSEPSEINNSGFAVTKLHVHFVGTRLREQFLTPKRYCLHTPHGEVLLPLFSLELEETVSFSLKSFLFCKQVTDTGIKA